MTTPTQNPALEWTDATWERELANARPQVERFAARFRGVNRSDLAQDAMIGAWRSRRQYRGTAEAGALAGWLRSIVRKTAMSAYRRDDARPKLGRAAIADPSADLRDEVFEDFDLARFNAAMAQLWDEAPDQAEVIALSGAGLGQREIASVIVRPVGTVKSRRKRGLDRLREYAQSFGRDIASNHGSLAR